MEQRRQTQSSATYFQETSTEHIYITSGRIWTVEIMLEIIQDVLFLFLNSKIIIESIDHLKR